MTVRTHIHSSSWLRAGSLAFLWLAALDAPADCAFSPTAGNDSHLCDSGSAAALSDLQGNNSLTFPAGSSGVITGNVTFGNGNDSILMSSGQIGGSVNQGSGQNLFQISAGTVVGAVSQGAGVDSFVMTGGQIQSLGQGDGVDTFLMSDGRIVGAFEGGDVVTITGGSIGRVDIGLGSNIFDMSGGRIDANLIAGLANDTLTISGGSIGGNVSVTSGDDRLTFSGGDIGGQVLMGLGNDSLLWSGGVIRGAVQMADDNDTALLRNLDDSVLALTPSVDGGVGVDQLTFDATSTASGARYVNWETLQLSNGSLLSLADALQLGDSVSGSGQLTIDATSTVASSQGSILPFAAGQNASVVNAGLIDLTGSGERADDSLGIVGNYTGASGRLNLQSVLAGDGAASDRLQVSRGVLSGSTLIQVANLGGQGDLTTQDGILLVAADQGAASSDQAFSLSGGGISAGAFQYYLFKGGISAGTENNWYLRSSVAVAPVPEPSPVVPDTPAAPTPAPEAPVPETPVPDTPVPQPSPPQPPALPGTPAPAPQGPRPAPGTPALPQIAPGKTVALYRLEVPLYSAVLPTAALLARTALGTFHERQGEQSLLMESGPLPAGWARVYGRDARQSWSGTVDPSFDGNIEGFQIGNDLFGTQADSGNRQRAGLFVGHARLDGDVQGFALGFEDRHAGDLRMDADSLGVYWTLVAPAGGYVDAVAMGSRLDGRARSERGMKLDLDGDAFSLSLEGGYPLPLAGPWVVEPQTQLIVQWLSMDSDADAVSRVSFDAQEQLTGRLGARLKGAYRLGNVPLEPYLRTDLWHAFGGHDTTTFASTTAIRTDRQSSSFEVGGGISARIDEHVSIYLAAGYSGNLDSLSQEASQATLGIRASW